MPGACPIPERLAAALRCSETRADDIELAGHLAECPACQARIETLAGGTGWWEAKARIHGTNRVACEPLRQAISSLEARSASEAPDPSTPTAFEFLQPSHQPDHLGRVGPYEVLEHIASGGMGIVFRASDPALDRTVAIKILPPAMAANSLARARFVREARAAAAVVHDHVVPIYAVDEFRGIPYLVMQFVHGRSLSERLRAGVPLRLEEILRIGAQTAAGLAAAHAQGLIHRDIKPGNILLENSVERVKLTDFGLARAADDTGLTRTGELAGTPEFMAPEQASNETVDERSDLFSLGSVLYAMCTGCSPFQGRSVIAVVRKVCDAQPPPPHEINPAIPRWLSEIVARLMAKAPEARFQSAREVGALLESYLARVQRGELGELPRAGPRASTRRHARQLYWALGATAALALAVSLTGTLLNQRPPGFASKAASPIRNPFVVRDQSGTSLGEFAQIGDALSAARAGSVVELCWDGPRDLPGVTAPDKPLTLRAGPGFEPTWICRDPSKPGLSAGAPLVLEDIRFVLDTRTHEAFPTSRPGGRRRLQPGAPSVPPSGVALVSITNGTLRVTRCVLDVRQAKTNDLACIVLENAGACRLESTLLFARMNKGVVWRERLSRPARRTSESSPSEASLTFTNCIAFAEAVVWLDLAEPVRARLEITRSTFSGLTSLYLPRTLAVGEFAVETRQSLLDTSRVIYDERGTAAPALPQWIRWHQRDNLFSPVRSYVAFPPPTPDSGLATLKSWNEWWNQTDETSRHVTVAFANGRSDSGPRAPLAATDPSGFQVTDLQVGEGRPLPRDQWSRFGADPATVSPAQPQ
jgi:serine/threonine-protein kinase